MPATRALLLALLVHSVFATFVTDNIQGTYNRSIGLPLCASTISFSRSSRTLPPAAISLNNQTCTGGALSVTDPAADDGPFATIFLDSTDVGRFLRATLDAPLVCGPLTLPADTELHFVSPTNDVTLDLAELLGSDAPDLFGTGNTTLTLRASRAYVFQDRSCAFDRPIPADEKETFSVLDSLTECFPASARLTLPSGAALPMRELRIGHHVLVGPHGATSSVFAFTHADRYARATFRRLVTAAGTLTVTRGHVVYANGRPVPAGLVRVGDVLTRADGAFASVVKVSDVQDVGLFNPQTLQGDIIVDGFVSTTYTVAVPPPTAHALLAPVRFLYNIAARVVGPASAGVLVWE